MILVAGGTGRLGTLVVTELLAGGHAVRVLTRDPARARRFPEGALEIVRGDVRDKASLVPAMRDVTVVVSAVQGFAGPGRVTPETVDHRGNKALVDAADGAGADVVMMSVVGASADSPMELFRAKFAAEEHLRAARVRWTIVRATAFVELWSEIVAKAPVLGRGDNPINFVCVHDVAAAVARAAVEPWLRGHVIEVGGPENLTLNELAVLVRGDGGRIHHVPRMVLRALALVARKPRAALVMDTVDMTFDGAAARSPIAEIPLTDARTAISRPDGRSRIR